MDRETGKGKIKKNCSICKFIKATSFTVGKDRALFILVNLALLLCLLLLMTSFATGTPIKTATSEISLEPQIEKGQLSDETDPHKAGIGDEQMRQVLGHKLEQETGDSQPASEKNTMEGEYTPSTIFYKLAHNASIVANHIASFFSIQGNSTLKWGAIFNRLTDGKGIGHLLMTVFIGFILIACGILAEQLFLRLTDGPRQQIMDTLALGKLQKIILVLSRLLLEALGVGVYMLTTFVLFVIIFREKEAGYWIVALILISSYYFWVTRFIAKIIMSPASPSLRLLLLQDRDAKFLYQWIIRISLVAIIIATPGLIFLNIGQSEALYTISFIASGLSVIILVIAMIWKSRKRVAEAICADFANRTCNESSLRAKFAKTWQYFASLYVAGIGAIWLMHAFLGSKGKISNLIGSLFMIPVFIGLDQWLQRLLKIASGDLPKVIELSSDDESEPAEEPIEDKKRDIKHFAPLISKAFRFLLVAFLLLIVLRLWGLNLLFGLIFAREALSVLIVVLLGFVFWEFIKARIDHKLKEESSDADEEMEEGGAGGSRTVTLLVLLRKFVLVVMSVMVSFIILSSIGVNIGPLIAGAGVIGLAIGFGAQTLVKDIISGVFFLIDDAFRVGDYIEVGGTTGSVEHISLRSLRLRSARGPVHTIPFGSMGTVTNNSRDYIISKLDFRVRYDTEVDKVRKIIKKINMKIMADEEMSHVMLDKLKSQGVRELDDSAMVMRVKFKTIPGEQFVIRREVYRMIQEAFRENGIEFAHRNVTVYMPPEVSTNELVKINNKMAEAGAAAAVALSAEQAEEEQKKSK